METFRSRVYNEMDIQRLLCSEYTPLLFNYFDISAKHDKIYIAMERARISLDRLIFYKKQEDQSIPLYVIQRVNLYFKIKMIFSGLEVLYLV